MFGLVFDLLHDAVIIVDSGGGILYANKAASQLFGYPIAEIVHLPLSELIPVRFRQHHDRYLQEFVHSGNSKLMGDRPVLQALHRNGEEIPVSISLCSAEADGQRIAVAIIRDLSAVSAKIEEARALAETDTLTGLGNRLHLSMQLTRLLQDADRPLALLYLDVDGFKAVNDRYGHENGDRLLKIVAGRLKASVRDKDLIVRVGGDEFVVVLPGLAAEESVRRIATVLTDAVSQRFNAHGLQGSIGVSIGWALYPRDGATEADLLRAADAMMYQVKVARRESRSAP